MNRGLLLFLSSVAIGVPLVVACSSSDGSRTPFTATATTAETPTEPNPSTTATTPPTTTSTSQQKNPVTPTGDASAPPPANCTKVPPSNVCGVAPQCGCGVSETCDVTDPTGATTCTSSGKAPMGQPCTGTSGCALGLTCVGGTCHAYCNNPGSACTVAGTGICEQIQQDSKDVPNLAVCHVACAPQDPMSCGGTTVAGTAACMVDDQGGTDCGTAGTQTVNETCSDTAGCGPALVCITITQGSTTTDTCKKWCRVGQADCGAGITCTGLQTAVMVGGVEYGVCP